MISSQIKGFTLQPSLFLVLLTLGLLAPPALAEATMASSEVNQDTSSGQTDLKLSSTDNPLLGIPNPAATTEITSPSSLEDTAYPDPSFPDSSNLSNSDSSATQPPLQIPGLNDGTTVPSSLAQSSSFSELSDISPGDWAYEALRSLIEDYGCLQGYPNRTFRGNRVITRYEFAAALSACLGSITQLLEADRPMVNRLLDEYKNDLIADINSLRSRVDQVQDNQFSSTTRLFGQVIVGIQSRESNRADFAIVDGVRDTNDPGTNTTLFSNAQLSLVTRLDPRSLLLIGIQAGQGDSFPALTNNVRLGYEGNTNFRLLVSDFTYRRLIGNRLAVIVGAAGISPVNVFRGANRIESAGSGPLSAFAQRNPVVSIGQANAGVGFDWQIADRISLQGVYASANASNPAPNSGLFGGNRTLGFQLTLAPSDAVDVALHYVNAYSTNGILGTGIGDDQLTAGEPITTNAFGATAAWRVTPRFTIGTWGGYTTSVTPGGPGSVNTTNWMLFANFPDLLGSGNMGGIYLGQPPKIINSTLRQGQNIPNLLAGGLGDPGSQSGTTTHLEMFYRYQVNDNLSITPGFIFIFQPANTVASETITIGALRTTLTF